MKKLVSIFLVLILITGCVQVNEPTKRNQEQTFNFSELEVASHEAQDFELFKQTLDQTNLSKRFRSPSIDFIDSISITGWDNGHTDDVRDAFYEGYYNSIYFDFRGLIKTAIDLTDPSYMSGAATPYYEYLEGYEALIHSYVSPVDYVHNHVFTPGGDHYASGIEEFVMFHAAGSNSFVHVNKYLPIEELTGNHFVTGCGVDNNTTGYWIEFFEIDPVYNKFSSFSNGYIAGQVLAVYNTALLYYPNLRWDHVKAATIKTSTQRGVWDEYDGYGKVRPLHAMWELFRTRFR